MERKLRLDICDYNNNVLCNLYDSTSNVTGQAHNVFIDYERNGWKELTFSIPATVERNDEWLNEALGIQENNQQQSFERNYRLNYLVADYRIRAIDDYETDWYLISEPKITHENFSNTVNVRAGHISQILKTKNLGLEFSDSEGNNIGTAQDLLEVILDGTGWVSGTVYEFKEDDGSTKVRTLNSPAKTGALKLISDLCELFDAKAVFHGEGRTVDILPLNPFSEEYTEGVPEEVTAENALELFYGRNVKAITRTLNTENLITKLYAEGSYGKVETGICNIETCTHEEYTFTSVAAGADYYFKDSTGGFYYFSIPEGESISGTLVWSKLDLLSRSYVWDEQMNKFFEVSKKGKQTNELNYTIEEKENYIPFIMNFEYFRKIGLLNDDQMLELIKYQRSLPDLYKESREASKALSEARSELSETAEPRLPFLRFAVDTNSVSSENGHLVLPIKTSIEDNGVMYRSDYDATKQNYFSWYVAGELDTKGDPISKLGSIVLIVHSNKTWSMGYLEKIYHNDNELIVDQDGKPTHYYYNLTKGGEPNKIVLYLNSSDVSIKKDDKFYLFCANSMSGRLGTLLSTDEAILRTLENQLKDENIKHPVFFTPSVDTSYINYIPANEYGWLYKTDINSKQWTSNIKQELYFCDKGRGNTSWCKVDISDTVPEWSSKYSGHYLFARKYKTLYYGSGAWLKMDSKSDQRLANKFSIVITACEEREVAYKGFTEKYIRNNDSLAIGNYAVKTNNETFILFSTDMVTDKKITIDVVSGRVYQKDKDEMSVVSFVERRYDTVDFPRPNILENAVFTTGSITQTAGTETANQARQKTGYIRILANQEYECSMPDSSFIYFYDENKLYLGYKKATGKIKTPAASEIPNTVTDIDKYKGGAYYARVVILDNQLTESNYIRLVNYDTSLVANDKVYSILSGFQGEGEVIGIDNIMDKFSTLADNVYGVLLPEQEEKQNAIKEKDLTITNVLGDMMREGYWQDNNYVEGDETRLYKDALDNLKEISKPETTYDIDYLDLYSSNDDMGYYIADETNIANYDIKITDAVHLIDEDLDTSCWGYIDKLHKCYDQPWLTTLEINTKLTLIDQHDFTDVMTHIADVAKQTKAKQTLYERAASLTGSGQLAAEKLSGTLDAYRTQITGGSSSWATDEKGNIIFVSSDGKSAMMLSGNGLCIANSRDDNGDWNWKTAATGSGIVADAITTGTLSAVLIEAGAITSDKISSVAGQDLDLSSNTSLNFYATVDGSKPAGGLETPTASSGESFIKIAAQNGNNPAYINIASGGNINVSSGSTLNLSGASMNLDSESSLNISAGGSIKIETGGANNKFIVNSPNFKVDANNNVTIAGTVTAKKGEIGGFTIGDNAIYSGPNSISSTIQGVYLGTDGIIVGSTTNGFIVSNDGSKLKFSGAVLSVDANTGAIDVKSNSTISVNANQKLTLTTNGTIKIGKSSNLFTIGADASGGLEKNINRTYIYYQVSSINDVKNDGIYLGTDGIVLGKNKFRVLASGSVTAEDITINGGSITIKKSGTTTFSVSNTGVLTATSGTIGGISVNTDGIYTNGKNSTTSTKTGFFISKNGEIYLGAYNNTAKACPFQVDSSGSLTASDGTIGGWTIGQYKLSSGSGSKYVALNTTGTYAIWAGKETNDKAPFSVTHTGEMKALSGMIGGWTIKDLNLYAGSNSTYVRLDGSSETKTFNYYDDNGKEQKSKQLAMWVGNETDPNNAPFSVTKDGIVTIRALRVNLGTESKPKYYLVDFSNWCAEMSTTSGSETVSFESVLKQRMGKLQFQTIKSIKVNETTGEVKIFYTNNSGGTATANFNSAASVYIKGDWSSPADLKSSTYTARPKMKAYNSKTKKEEEIDANKSNYVSTTISGAWVWKDGKNPSLGKTYVTKDENGSVRIQSGAVSVSYEYDKTYHWYKLMVKADGEELISPTSTGTDAYKDGQNHGSVSFGTFSTHYSPTGTRAGSVSYSKIQSGNRYILFTVNSKNYYIYVS